MLVYYTSNIEKLSPNVYQFREYRDFGRGFYVTSNQEQAELYGQHYLQKGETAYLFVFELDDIPPLFTYKRFQTLDGEWLDYVIACWKGKPQVSYDIIEGGIVDYQVFDIVDLYLKKKISREEAISQLSSKTPNFHICINNQLIISRLLHPVKSVKLSKHHNLKHKFSTL